MKKLILTAFLFGVFGLFAQIIDKSKFWSPANAESQIVEKRSTSSMQPFTHPKTITPPTGFQNSDVVNPIALAQAGNAWGFAYMRTT